MQDNHFMDKELSLLWWPMDSLELISKHALALNSKVDLRIMDAAVMQI